MKNFSDSQKKYMKRALELAKLGEGTTSPNPMVGAVVVKDKKIIGEGYHQKFGGPHAEVFALEEAGKEAFGADIYITLEPCSHYGKTPPCAQKIIDMGINRAFIAMGDPNPKVAGRGIKILKDADIEVNIGLLKKEAQTLNEIFLKYIQSDYPFIFLKKAQTLDGYIATKNGDSKWITNSAARLEGHKLRHRVDAIMVGIGTILADNPSLTTRLDKKNGIDPIRIILDPLLEISPAAKIINQKSDAKTLIITADNSTNAKIEIKKEKLKRKKQVEVFSFPVEKNNYFNLKKLLKKLREMKISSILVEGGAKLSHTFLKKNLVDKFYYFIAPKIYGGSDGTASFSGKGVKLMSDAVELEILEQRNIDNNILLIAKRK